MNSLAPVNLRTRASATEPGFGTRGGTTQDAVRFAPASGAKLFRRRARSPSTKRLTSSSTAFGSVAGMGRNSQPTRQ